MGGVLTAVFVLGLGFGYPTYKTVLAMENDDREEKELLLQYWVVFGIAFSIHSILEPLLFFIPFYSYLFVAFLGTLNLPQTQVTTSIYEILKEHLPPISVCIFCDEHRHHFFFFF